MTARWKARNENYAAARPNRAKTAKTAFSRRQQALNAQQPVPADPWVMLGGGKKMQSMNGQSA